MIRVAFSLIIFGITVLAISIGFLILNEAQLDELPRNPVNQLLIAEKKNLEETQDIAQVGVLVSSITIGISAITASLLYWRNR